MSAVFLPLKPGLFLPLGFHTNSGPSQYSQGMLNPLFEPKNRNNLFKNMPITLQRTFTGGIISLQISGQEGVILLTYGMAMTGYSPDISVMEGKASPEHEVGQGSPYSPHSLVWKSLLVHL